MVKKGQLDVSRMDSPKQAEDRDAKAPKRKMSKRPGSRSQRRGRGQSEGSSAKG